MEGNAGESAKPVYFALSGRDEFSAGVPEEWTGAGLSGAARFDAPGAAAPPRIGFFCCAAFFPLPAGGSCVPGFPVAARLSPVGPGWLNGWALTAAAASDNAIERTIC